MRLADNVRQASAHFFPLEIMCYCCDAMAPTCDWACAPCVEDVFEAPPRRSRNFRPPSLAEFLKQLLAELPLGSSSTATVKASQERTERARNRAERTETSLGPGMTSMHAFFRTSIVHCFALSSQMLCI